MLIEKRLDRTIDKINIAVQRLKEFEPHAIAKHENGYHVAYSGGKDSVVIAELCKMAGVKFEIVNNHTTVDPPELVYFVREQFERYRKEGIKCTVVKPKETMWQLIVRKKTPPTRIIRYCCEILKETSGAGRFVVTGVRWAESVARKNRSAVFHPNKKDNNGKYVFTNDNDEAKQMIGNCVPKQKLILNPIIDWEDEDVWEFIKSRNIPYCKLYDEGFTRLGCIGCPMAGDKRKQEFKRYPKYRQAYVRTFDRMLAAKSLEG